MAEVWEQSKSSNSKTDSKTKLRVLLLAILISPLLLLLSLACNANTSGQSPAQIADAAVVNTRPQQPAAAKRQVPANAAPLDQSKENDIEALLVQLRRAGPPETEAAEALLLNAQEMAARGAWDGANKTYGESILFKPNSAAMLGLAKASMMAPTERPTKDETIAAKVRWFKGAVARYRLALEFSKRAGEPLSTGQKADVEKQLSCLEAFIQNPDPASESLCPSVREALKLSGLN